MENSITILQTLEKGLSLINITVYIAVIIIALNCIWRVEAQFDRFLKYLTLSLCLVPARLILGVLDLERDPIWMFVIRCFGFLSGLLLIIAFSDLLRSIKSVNNEKN